MSIYRNSLPQLSGDLYLTDAGLETDIIFNHGIDIPEFAAHTLLPDESTREIVRMYLARFLTLAAETDSGFILDGQTWKAHRHWAVDLGASIEDLRAANADSMSFIAGIRDEFSHNSKPIVLNAVIGPQGDAYAPEAAIASRQAEEYHAEQLGWLAATEADMVTALTFTQSDEAIGVVRAAVEVSLPIVVSFTVETDGRLPTGQPLHEAITQVDEATDSAAAYFMVNCAHPEHFSGVLEGDEWARRIQGLRCNASRQSHAELDECDTLDDGDTVELAGQYRSMIETMPWVNVVGGCCGTDLRHVREIHRAIAA